MNSMIEWLWLVLLTVLGGGLIVSDRAARRRRQPARTLGDLLELQVRLEQGESLAITDMWCRRGRQRVEFELDGIRLEAWCYWPVRVQPVRLWSVRWIEKVGWGLDVQTATGPARLYAWHLRCGASQPSGIA